MLQQGVAAAGRQRRGDRRRHRSRRGDAPQRRRPLRARPRPKAGTPTSPPRDAARDRDGSRELTRISATSASSTSSRAPASSTSTSSRTTRSASAPSSRPAASAPARLCSGVGRGRRSGGPAGAHQPGGAGAALPAVRRGAATCSSRSTAPKPATWRCAPSRPAGVYVGGGIAPKILPALRERAVPGRVPRQGADGGSRRDHPGRRSSSIPTRACSAPRFTPSRRSTTTDLLFRALSPQV